MSAYRGSCRWFAAHLIAFGLASLVASLVLTRDAPFLAVFAWPAVFLYAVTAGSAAYAVAINLRQTDWLSAMSTGAAIGGGFALMTVSNEGFRQALASFSLAGAAGGLTFRAVVVHLVGTSWMAASDGD